MARFSRALRSRNYRLYFFGQGVSLVGTWLTKFAMPWMAYRLTDSGLVLGLVAFFSQAPTAILAPIAGVMIDRWDRHRVIVITQIFAMLQSAALALFTFTGWMTEWHLLGLGAVQAVINAFDTPARQAFVGQMVEDRADLPNAIALNSSMVTGARILGPVVAAALVGLFGEGLCFTIDAASYLAVIASLLMMTVPKHVPKPRTAHVLDEMRDGLRYVRRTPLVKQVLLLLAASSMLGGAYTTLLPLVAGHTLAGGPHTAGVLYASAGAGALVGALYLASRTSVAGLPNVIGYATTTLGVGLCLLYWAPNVYVAAPLICACGLGWMIQMASTNTIIQSTVDPQMLGRVMGLYVMAFFGGAPLGALMLGWLADAIGPMTTFLCAGVAVLACAAGYRLSRNSAVTAVDLAA